MFAGEDELSEIAADSLQALRRSARSTWRHADVLLERCVHSSARQVDGTVADASTCEVSGTACRALEGESVRYAVLDQVTTGATREALARLGGRSLGKEPGAARPALAPAQVREADLSSFFETLRSVDEGARATDPRVEQVLIDAETVTRSVAVAALGGEVRRDQRWLLYLTIRVLARERDRVAAGFYTPGSSRAGQLTDGRELGGEAARRAVAALAARPAPVTRSAVVVAGGRGMVLIHEACCHPLEADEIFRGSVYAERLGEMVASPLVTIVDDATVPGGVGSMGIDDEGHPSASTPLVENGRLVGFLTDEVAARRLGRPATCNGRRADYRFPVLPRMTNTCVAAGGTDPADIVADTEQGIWAQHVAGGEVVEATGDFVFRVTNGYLIEGGRISDPIEETTIAGNGRQVLLDVDAVGDDVRLGAAKCGKFDQLIPVGVQGPTLRVRNLLIGGTAA